MDHDKYSDIDVTAETIEESSVQESSVQEEPEKSQVSQPINWTKDTPYLVIVNYYDHDISWAKSLKFPHIVYYKEKPEQEPFSASNKAKSETNLLKFISDFYDDLPKNVIIVHQYEKKFYHKGSLLDILNDPEFETKYNNSKTLGFWNFNTQVLGNINYQVGRMIESKWWPECMEPYFGPIDGYIDFTNGKNGCAQFVLVVIESDHYRRVSILICTIG